MFVYHNFSRVVGATSLNWRASSAFALLHFSTVVSSLFICQTLIRAALASLCCSIGVGATIHMRMPCCCFNPNYVLLCCFCNISISFTRALIYARKLCLFCFFIKKNKIFFFTLCCCCVTAMQLQLALLLLLHFFLLSHTAQVLLTKFYLLVGWLLVVCCCHQAITLVRLRAPPLCLQQKMRFRDTNLLLLNTQLH